MASLEFIRYVPRNIEVVGNQAQWIETRGQVIERLPQLVWENNSTWAEANVWAFEKANSNRNSPKTVLSSMSHLLGYANWLEAEGIGWWHFPVRESERCLPRFRGALIRAKDAGEIAPSTASVRMSAVVRLYRWLQATKLLSTDWPMWKERQIGVRLTDAFGFEHTLRVNSTDLAIANRAVAGAIKLEDGVMPVTIECMHEILEFAEVEASEELALMLRIGFGTGLRLGSILDLKPETLERACVDPETGWNRISVGPGARPPVATKFGVSGMVPIAPSMLDRLREYAQSTRRLKRQALAATEHRNLLFLTRCGNPYIGLTSRAVNVQMTRLREAATKSGLSSLHGFHFHRTRATFATTLMRAALKCLPVSEAVQLVREACLHRDEATTLKYVKFIEKSKAMAEAADAFTEAFLGLARGSRNG